MTSLDANNPITNSKNPSDVIDTIKGMNLGEFKVYVQNNLAIFSDPDYVIPMIKSISGIWLEFIPYEIFNYRNVIKEAIKADGTHIRFSDMFIDDKVLATKAVKKTPHAFCYLSPRLRGDHTLIELYLSKIEWQPLVDKIKPDYWISHLDIAKKVLSKHGSLLVDFPDEIRKNIELCKVAIQSEPLKAYQQIHPSLKDNEELLHYAISQDGENLAFAHSKFQRNKEYVLEAVQSRGFYFQNKIHDGTPFSKDLDVVRAALLKYGFNYNSVDEDIKKENIDFAVIALEKSSKNFAFIPELHHDNPKVLAALYYSDPRQFFAVVRISTNLKNENDKHIFIKNITNAVKDKPIDYFIESLKNMDYKYYECWKSDETITVERAFNANLNWHRRLLFDHIPMDVYKEQLPLLQSPVLRKQITLEMERKQILELSLPQNNGENKQSKIKARRILK